MEPISRASGTVLTTGIAHMAAARVLGGELLRLDGLEAGTDDSKRRQFNKREN